MYYKTLKTPGVALIGAGLLIFVACQESSVDSPCEPADSGSVIVRLPAFSPSLSRHSL